MPLPSQAVVCVCLLSSLVLAPARAKAQEIVFSLFAMVMQKMAEMFPTCENRTWGTSLKFTLENSFVAPWWKWLTLCVIVYVPAYLFSVQTFAFWTVYMIDCYHLLRYDFRWLRAGVCFSRFLMRFAVFKYVKRHCTDVRGAILRSLGTRRRRYAYTSEIGHENGCLCNINFESSRSQNENGVHQVPPLSMEVLGISNPSITLQKWNGALWKECCCQESFSSFSVSMKYECSLCVWFLVFHVSEHKTSQSDILKESSIHFGIIRN